jgi:hypothetical protein
VQRLSAQPGLGWRVGIALVTVVATATAARAGPPAADAPDAIFVAAREAVAQGRTQKTALAGFDPGRAAVTADDAPAGGILVGFEVGLGDWFGRPTVFTLRPLYLTANGHAAAQTFGLAQGRRAPGKNGPKSKVTRVVTVQARPGYAVGEIAIDSGLNIDGLAVTFMRIRGTALDPNQSYTEDWVGRHEDKTPKFLSGGGDPIVGVFARQDEVRVMAVGLVRMRPPEPAAAPAPAQKPATRPAPPRRPAEPEPPDEPPARPAGKAPPAAQPPAAERPPDPAPEEPVRRPAKPSPDEGGFPWLPLVAFAAVSGPLFLGLMVVLRRKEPTRRRLADDEETPDEPAAVGAAGSTDLCAAPRARRAARGSENTDICNSPSPARRQERSDDDLEEVLPAVDEVEVLPSYFEARAVFNFRPNRLLRVYVLRDRLLFFDVDAPGAGAHLAWIIPVGLMFGLVGGLIAWFILKHLATKPVPQGRDLDDLGADELITRAKCSHGCFQAAPGELSEVRLEPPSFWHSLWWAGSRYAGVLYLRHGTYGRYALQVLGLEDMKLVAEALPNLLGRRMEVNAVFSRQLWQFVRR